MYEGQEGDVFGVGQDGHRFRSPIDEFMKVEGDGFHLYTSGLYFGQVENAVEQVEQARRGATETILVAPDHSIPPIGWHPPISRLLLIGQARPTLRLAGWRKVLVLPDDLETTVVDRLCGDLCEAETVALFRGIAEGGRHREWLI